LNQNPLNYILNLSGNRNYSRCRKNDALILEDIFYMEAKIIKADYTNAMHSDALVKLLNIYASGPTGGGVALPEYTMKNLTDRLSQIPAAFSLLAFDGNTPAGLANCFETFSTFACRPLINIHDLMVAPEYRRKGIGEMLINRVVEQGREIDACRITLEVLAENTGAKMLYEKCGFNGYELTPEMGKALFWEKKI